MTHSLSSLASSFSLNPVNNYKNPPSPTASLPISTLQFPSFPPKFSRNGKWASGKNRYYFAKPADQDLDTREPSSLQVSSKNTTGSGNASTSFLSILCPLLRLFSVYLSLSLFKIFGSANHGGSLNDSMGGSWLKIVEIISVLARFSYRLISV